MITVYSLSVFRSCFKLLDFLINNLYTVTFINQIKINFFQLTWYYYDVWNIDCHSNIQHAETQVLKQGKNIFQKYIL